MIYLSYLEQKNRICELINLISEHYGGDKQTIQEYCDNVINIYRANLHKALVCFEDVYNNLV